ncbi:hypothetical protein GPJ56_010972 [Histomonas meleagridis]|uniref:uncharacterized protein n=1 Tax=Histomonas meleagridis TaxID=135588 RepID=UPI003559BA43|nr:hypothetical protein GPJ56_010972 [Histomonas meleagridis]KAH0800749.1 hypothetical protein GO595_006502 [Histomonas meleagridis]
MESLFAVHQEEENHAMNTIIDQQIIEVSSCLRDIQDEERNLGKQLMEIETQLEEVKAENDRLDSECQEPNEEVDINTSFFEQLRQIESLQEHFQAQIKGLKVVNQRVKNEINSKSSKLRRAILERNENLKQMTSITNDKESRAGDLSAKRAELFRLDEQLDTITQECESIKKSIKEQTESFKIISPDSNQLLLNQKRDLEKQLQSKNEKIKQLLMEEKALKVRFATQQKSTEKESAAFRSPNYWINDRLNLLTKIKKTKEEINQMKVRQRSVVKGSQKDGWNEEDAKYAIQCEIQSLNYEKFQFLENTLAVEIGYRKQMEEELNEIEDALTKVQEFKSETEKYREGSTGEEEEIELLKKELEELRRRI